VSVEIEIRRDWLTWGPRLLALAAALLVLSGMYALGYVVSPRAADGRPQLLLPDVRAVEMYRRQAAGWAQSWRTLDTDMKEMLRVTSSDSLNLLALSRQAQVDFNSAIDLARAVDGTEAPPALLGLHDQVAVTAQAYVDASVALNRWLSAPTVDNRATAEQAYQVATASLVQVEANAWLQPTEK
jgi:hypothetical protein